MLTDHCESSDPAIFVMTDRQTDRQTEPIALPLVHVRGVIIISFRPQQVLRQTGTYTCIYTYSVCRHTQCHTVL